ncbi:MAG: GNAT family N-acetyltransferase [Hyphomicrobiaceae bacterium]
MPVSGFDVLACEARSEGFRFIARLEDDWASGANRFAKPGERLVAATAERRPIGIGGLNRDPFASEARVGRLRHLYVYPAWQRQGVASAIVAELPRDASMDFDRVRLRSYDAAVAAFYVGLGFVDITEAEATHSLLLNSWIERRPAQV